MLSVVVNTFPTAFSLKVWDVMVVIAEKFVKSPLPIIVSVFPSSDLVNVAETVDFSPPPRLRKGGAKGCEYGYCRDKKIFHRCHVL